MSIFSNLNTENMQEQKDVLGGGYTPLESGIYPAKIKSIYITTSKRNAMAANVIADIDGKEYREQLWITNSEGKPYYVSKQSGEKIALPGYTILNDICLCTTGKELKEIDAEPRTFKIYDMEAKKELPKEVPTIIELQDAVVDLGIIHEIVDKTVKNANGAYVPSGETREQNVIAKVFHSGTHKTVNEAREGKTEAEFYNKWLEKNKGVTRNRAKGKSADAGTAGAPQKPAAATKPLFS